MDNLQDKLAQAERKLERVRNETKSAIDKFDLEVESAKRQNLTAETVKSLEATAATVRKSHESTVARLESEVEQLREQIHNEEIQRQDAAKGRLEAMKAKARVTWLSKGGDPDGFESVWQKIKADILTKETLESITPKESSPMLDYLRREF